MGVDVVVLCGLLAGVLLGRRRGLASALWGVAGALAGTAAGLALVPRILGGAPLSFGLATAAVALVGVSALGTRAVALALERRLRSGRGLRAAPVVNRVTGACFGAAIALSLGWMAGQALAASNFPGAGPAVSASRSVALLEQARLPVSHLLLDGLGELADRRDFPRYVDVFAAERIRPVPPAPRSIATDPDVVNSSRSVWRVLSRNNPVTASEGTAFLVGPGRLVTAAHVVADSRGITVGPDGGGVAATVIFCDPEHDVAVLDAPGARGRPLEFAPADPGQAAAAIGYPGNGPLTVGPARVREHRSWQSPDIWGEGRFENDALVIRGVVRGGNSGGPLVDAAGDVLGVVVASSRADEHTGYVLSPAQVSAALDAARGPAPAGDGSCRR